MDNGWRERLMKGASGLGVEVVPERLEKLEWLTAELLRWGRQINLTAILDAGEILEKHLLDSLAILPELDGVEGLLDVGSGAGFPALPLAVARPTLRVVAVDAVAKKVGFMKHAIAGLGLRNASAYHRRLEGRPEVEGIAPAARVVSRALTDLGPWLELARPYLAEGGKVIAMRVSEEAGTLESVCAVRGFRCDSLRAYALPFSGAPRAVATFSVI